MQVCVCAPWRVIAAGSGGGGLGARVRACFIMCLGHTPACGDEGYSPKLQCIQERQGVHFSVPACARLHCVLFVFQ